MSAYVYDVDKRTTVTTDPYYGEQTSVEWIGDSFTCTWTCSDGSFVESGTNTVQNAFSVTWGADDTPTDNVTISCEANDGAVVPDGEQGSRDDGAQTCQQVLPIRFPKTITISHRLHNGSDPPLERGNSFGFYNIIKVRDNRGVPFPGLWVDQDVLIDPGARTPLASHGSRPWTAPETEDSCDWLHDVEGMNAITDQMGNAKDLVQGQNENAVRFQTYHKFKRVKVPAPPPGLKKFYWNPSPYPECTRPHADHYGAV